MLTPARSPFQCEWYFITLFIICQHFFQTFLSSFLPLFGFCRFRALLTHEYLLYSLFIFCQYPFWSFLSLWNPACFLSFYIGFYLSPMLSPAGLLWVTRVSIILSFRLLSSPFFNFFNLASQPVPLPFYPAGFSSKPLCFVSWLTRILIIQIFPLLSTLFDKFF